MNSWPKPFFPPADCLRDAAGIPGDHGVWNTAFYSVDAAVLCMVFSIVLGAPAGYALARFSSRGHAYRLLVLLTRAFPVAILALPLTVGFIRLGLTTRRSGSA